MKKARVKAGQDLSRPEVTIPGARKGANDTALIGFAPDQQLLAGLTLHRPAKHKLRRKSTTDLTLTRLSASMLERWYFRGLQSGHIRHLVSHLLYFRCGLVFLSQKRQLSSRLIVPTRLATRCHHLANIFSSIACAATVKCEHHTRTKFSATVNGTSQAQVQV